MKENDLTESSVNEGRGSKGNEKRRSRGSKMRENEKSLISLVKENKVTEKKRKWG